jgi:hypothetical protein
MIFAVPVVGRILAACAASEASTSASPTENTTRPNLQTSGADAVNPAAFTQTLNKLEHAAASKAPLATIATS